MREYIAICPSIVGNMEHGFETVHGWDGARFPNWEAAKSHGFELRDSDDFNIGVLEGDTLVDYLWMDQPMNDPEGMAEVAAQHGFKLNK